MNARLAIFVLSSVAFSASILSGADLSRYRNFRLGMSVADVAKEAGIASEARLVSSRPQRVEELNWHARWTPPSTARPDPFQEIVFRFYNNELFQIAVTYDRDQTGGLTDDDMVEAISGVYGSATRPVAAETTFDPGFSKSVRVIARWKDAQYGLNLVQLPYEAGFGVVLSSTSNESMAEAAILESERLDRVEAPQRELALRARQSADAQAVAEKARSLNKPGFRP